MKIRNDCPSCLVDTCVNNRRDVNQNCSLTNENAEASCNFEEIAYSRLSAEVSIRLHGRMALKRIRVKVDYNIQSYQTEILNTNFLGMDMSQVFQGLALKLSSAWEQ